MENFQLPANLPEWFCLDKDAGISDHDIHEKIRIEVYNEVINQDCDMNLWTEEFIDEVADMYFRHFDKRYNDFCMSQLQTYMSRNKLLNAFDSANYMNAGYSSYLDNRAIAYMPYGPNRKH